jgi:hypothetical protein
MAKKPDFALLEVAVTLITEDQRILAVYNANWAAFTLPMTKRRAWRDPRAPKQLHAEEWLDAAARAAAEWLGRTCVPEFVFDDKGDYQQSDRDGTWKRYHFQVFRLRLQEEPKLVNGAVTEWLTAAEFLDRRPISNTARYLIKRLQAEIGG